MGLHCLPSCLTENLCPTLLLMPHSFTFAPLFLSLNEDFHCHVCNLTELFQTSGNNYVAYSTKCLRTSDRDRNYERRCHIQVI